MTPDEAKALTVKIQQALGDLIVLIEQAYEGKADEALGYPSWEEYVLAEFPNLPRMSRGERREGAKTLAAAGMTTREVAATLGIAEGTVRNDLPAQNCARTSSMSQAIDLVKQGASYREAAARTGLHGTTVGRNPEARAVHVVQPGEPFSQSIVRRDLPTAACRLEQPGELIDTIRGNIDRILSFYYELSGRDVRKLRRTLQAGINKVDERYPTP